MQARFGLEFPLVEASAEAVLASLDASLSTKLAAAIKGWRFTPYKDAGRAVPACFVNSFALTK